MSATGREADPVHETLGAVSAALSIAGSALTGTAGTVFRTLAAASRLALACLQSGQSERATLQRLGDLADELRGARALLDEEAAR